MWTRRPRSLLAHLKVLWEALEQGCSTKEIIEMLVECTDSRSTTSTNPSATGRLSRNACSTRPLLLCAGTYRRLPPRFVTPSSGCSTASPSTPSAAADFVPALIAVRPLLRRAHRGATRHLRRSARAGHAGRARARVTWRPRHTRPRVRDSVDVNAVAGVRRRRCSDPAGAARDRVRPSRTRTRTPQGRLRGEDERAGARRGGEIRETARRLLAVAERSEGVRQSGLLTAVEAAELLRGISRRRGGSVPIRRSP